MVGINVLNFGAKKVKNTVLVYAGLSGIGLGAFVLATLPYVGITILGCFLIGFSAAGIIVPTQTLIQQETPAALMGRVGSTVLSTIFSAQIGGLVLSGILARFVTLRTIFGLCTTMLVILIVVGKVWMEPKDEPAAGVARGPGRMSGPTSQQVREGFRGCAEDEVYFRLGVRGGDEGRFILTWRQPDAALQHGAVKAGEECGVRAAGGGEIVDRFRREEPGEHAADTVGSEADAVLGGDEGDASGNRSGGGLELRVDRVFVREDCVTVWQCRRPWPAGCR